MKKRVLCLLLALIMTVSAMPAMPASAVTTNDAGQWLLNHNGWHIDFDGVYGGQCVDLLMRYCTDLFGWYLPGNAWDWAWVEPIPAGWGRVWLKTTPGYIPRQGDIVVWNPNSGPPAYTGDLAHVGIVYSADANGMVTYEQNTGEGSGDGVGTYVRRLYRPYDGVWGFVRPPFSNSGSNPTPTPSTLTLDAPTLIYADDNNAQVESYIRNGGNPVYCSKFGLKVWEKATGKLIVDHKEDIPASVQGKAFIQIWVNLTRELGITLKPGTEYEWQYSAITDSGTVNSEKRTYKTTGPTPATPTPTPTPSPTPRPYNVEFEKPTVENLTSTSAVIAVSYTAKGMSLSPGLYTGCQLLIYKYRADGSKEKIGVPWKKYSEADKTDGKHTIKFNLNECGVRLEPGTKYRVTGNVSSRGEGFPVLEFTTPAESTTPSPTPTASPTPSPTPKPGSDEEPFVSLSVFGDYNKSMEYDVWALTYGVDEVHIYVEKDGQVILDRTDSKHFTYTFPGPGTYKIYAVGSSEDGPVSSQPYTVTIPGSADPGTPTPDPWTPTPDPGTPTPDPWVPSTPTPKPVQFVDVPQGKYFYSAVIWAVGEGITGGTSATTFSPDKTCTRVQIMTFLWASQGRPTPSGLATFSDMTNNGVFNKAISWAVENKVTGGVGDNKFGTNNPCTRVQAVTFLWIAAGKPTPQSTATFSDMPTNPVFRSAISWAVENKITGGVGNNKFGTNRPCTRGQIATFLYAASKLN